MTEESGGVAINRAEWIAGAAMVINLLTIAFGFGVVWAEVRENTRVNEAQEEKLDALIPAVARIEENVEFLAEAERDRRELDRARR